MNLEEIKKHVQDLGPWYQNFVLPGKINTRPNKTLYPRKKWDFIRSFLPDNLKGKSVLDLGCNAGYFSIQMKNLGAAQVLGIDSSLQAIEQAKFVAEVFEKDIKFEVNNIYKFIFANKKKFDYVIFIGLLYHLRYPLIVLDRLFELTKEKLILQTEFTSGTLYSKDKESLSIPDNFDFEQRELFEHPDFPKMCFIEKKFNKHYNNWWFCNEAGIKAILRSAGFKNIRRKGQVLICEPGNQRKETLDYKALIKILNKN